MSITSWFATGPDIPVTKTTEEVDREYRRQRQRIMIAITLGYGIAYTCRLALNVVKKPLIDQGIFTPAELGLIGSVLFYTYGSGKLFNGFFADHANVKRYMAAGILLSALANVGMGFTTTLTLAMVMWGLNGWFQSFGAPGSVVSLNNWFSNRERGRFYGIWSTAHSLGEGLTFAVVSAMASFFGWRFGFWGPGFLCIPIAICIYVLLPDRPRTLGLPTVADWRNDHYAPDAKPKATQTVLQTQLAILRIPAIWILALASASNYVTRYAINSWGVLYLQEARGYSLGQAGTLLTLSTLAGIAGAIGIGFVSDKWFAARRPPANLIFGVLEIIGLLLLFWGPGNTVVVTLALILFGFGMTGLVTSVGGLFAVDICPKRVAGAAMGVIGVFSYLGSALQEQISGVLIQRGMTFINGVRHYDFAPVILFWVGASVVSLILASSLWRTKLRD